jgi:putative Mn2+ efflux pump MntP
VLAILLVALSLGMSNFAASIGIGISGVDAATRWRVGVVFGLFEAGMPVVGLLLGRSVAGPLGGGARWIGAALLVATGGYGVIQVLRSHREELRSQAEGDGGQRAVAGQGIGRLLVAGAALSIDNLAVGFALGAYHVNLALAAVVIGAVSVGLSLAGLELGGRLGARTGRNGELLGGAVLIVVGIAVAGGVL